MAMGTIVLTICLVGVVMLLLFGGLLLIARLGSRDTVSTAREDWISRRSDKDERDW